RLDSDDEGTKQTNFIFAGKDGDTSSNGERSEEGGSAEKGEKGDHGDHGEKGDKGDHGDKGDKGDKGQHGRGVRKVMLKPGDVGYPDDCQPKPAVLVYTQHVDDASNSFVDDPLGTDNPTVVRHGKDGKDGKQ